MRLVRLLLLRDFLLFRNEYRLRSWFLRDASFFGVLLRFRLLMRILITHVAALPFRECSKSIFPLKAIALVH